MNQKTADKATKLAKKRSEAVYVFGTYSGMRLSHQKPPFGQQYYIFSADGSHEFVQPTFG